MVKFAALILLGFVACMAAAIPPTEDSNGHPRIRRTTYRNPQYGPIPVQGVTVPHNGHPDTVVLNSDGSVTRTHNYGHQPQQQNGFSPAYSRGYNPGLNFGINPSQNPGHVHVHDGGHIHRPGEAAVEITRLGTDELGHDVVTRTQVYNDGHTHSMTQHI